MQIIKVLLSSIVLLTISVASRCQQSYSYSAFLKYNSVSESEVVVWSIGNEENSTMDLERPNGSCAQMQLKLGMFADANYLGEIESEDYVRVKLEIFSGSTNIGDATLFIENFTDSPKNIDEQIKILTLDQENITIRVTEIYCCADLSMLASHVCTKLPKNLIISAELTCAPIIDFSYDLIPNLDIPNFHKSGCSSNEYEQSQEEITITWDNLPEAIGYDLEWTYCNDYNGQYLPNGTFGQVPFEAIDYNFKSNSTRVSLAGNTNSYTIPNLFDRGYVFFRIRAIGMDDDDPTFTFPGLWSSPNKRSDINNSNVPGNSNQLRYLHITQPHESKLNWQVTTTFAEEGKKKEVISYFDGTNRNRQTVTRINSAMTLLLAGELGAENVIVGETIYDWEGRPAINILPVPVLEIPTECIGQRNPLKYYRKFNRKDNSNSNEIETSYSWEDFDLDFGTVCAPISANPLAETSGAALYYSADNIQKNQWQGNVPTAGGYPLTQVEYTPDNTGRIRTQGGVGADYQIGSEHPTKYYYATPSQLELDRMFGSEVGNCKHYKKNMEVDPNGQISVSYLDMEGRTIATALAGGKPENLEALDSLKEAQYLTTGLFSTTPSDLSEANVVDNTNGTVNFSSTISATVPGTYRFQYHLEVPALQLQCLNNMCLDCQYQLTIEISDECGTKILEYSSNDPVQLFSDDTSNIIHSCSTPNIVNQFDLPTQNPTIDNWISVEIPNSGTYTINKRLSLYEPARQQALEEYLEQANTECISQFGIGQEPFVPVDCNVTCQECVDLLGDVDEFVASGMGTASQWQVYYDACMEPCNDYISPCDAALLLMLGDVSKGGQYGMYTTSPEDQISCSATEHPLSVFAIGNMLPKRNSADWKHPINPFIEGGNPNIYLSNDGTRVKVYLTSTTNSAGITVYTPSVHALHVSFDQVTGDPYTYPEFLVSLSDFLDVWQEGFERSLVTYHPEWCYYETCLSWGKGESDTENSSNGFDRLLTNVNTHAEAIQRGLLDSDSGLPTDWLHNNPGDEIFDPFMLAVISNSEYAEFGERLLSKWNNYGGGLSIYEFAARLLRCPGSTCLTADCSSCYAFGQEVFGLSGEQLQAFLNDEWNQFKTIYLSAKRQVQKAYADKYVINNDCKSFNECVGEDQFLVAQYPDFFVGYMNQSATANPFFDPYEICSYATGPLYHNKQPRFTSGNDIDEMGQGGAVNNLNAQLYYLTGQCPLDVSLQGLIGKLAYSSLLQGPQTNLFLNAIPEFSAVLNNMNPSEPLDGPLTDPANAWTWSHDFDGNFMIASISNPDNTQNFFLEIALNNDIAWSDVSGFLGLKVDVVENGTSGELPIYHFTISALVTLPNGFQTILPCIGATNWLPIGQCSFSPVHTPNELAGNLESMLNYQLSNGWYSSTTTFDNTPNNTTPDCFLIIPNLLEAPNGEVQISHLSGNKWRITELNHTTPSLVLNFSEFSNPSINFQSDLQGYYFDNLNTECENFFSINLVDVQTGEIVSTAIGRLDLETTDHQTIPVSLGDCSLPVPIECQNDQYEYTQDLENLIQDVLINYDNTGILVPSLLPSFTSVICNTLDSCPVSSPGIATIFDLNKFMIGLDNNCRIDLSILDNSITNIDYASIVEVGELVPYGEISSEGTFSEFTIDIIYTYHTDADYYQPVTLHGISCQPLYHCDYCEQAENVNTGGFGTNPGSGRPTVDDSEGKDYFVYRIEEKSVSQFNRYTSAVNAFNTKFELEEGDSEFIQRYDYQKFYDLGLMFSTDNYIDFLISFQWGVDSLSFTSIIKYAREFGNYTNIESEYERYILAIDGFNLSNEENTVEPITFTVFAESRVVNKLSRYIEYLFENSFKDTPLQITAWRNSLYGYPSESICSQKYQEYLDAYNLYAYWQSFDGSCPGFDKIYPVYSFEDFEAAGLCCSYQTLSEFTTFINEFYTPGACPDGMPAIAFCKPHYESIDPKDCHYWYLLWYGMVEAYNESAHSQSNNFNLTFNPNKDMYAKIEPYCDCVADYLSYLSVYLEEGSESLPNPENIATWSGCSAPDEYPCDTYYAAYENIRMNYNTWLVENPSYQNILPEIPFEYSQEQFGQQNLCQCIDGWYAFIKGLIGGDVTMSPSEILFNMDIANYCNGIPDDPCTSLADITVPNPEFSIPFFDCEEMNEINLENYNQYWQSLHQQMAADEFIARYNEHCLHGITEYMKMQSLDAQYHYTLYYYDQAGNLIKTVPPAGVRLLEMTSDEDLPETVVDDALLYNLIAYDREHNTHQNYTDHQLVTKYEYNSLNQLQKQFLPDHDPMNMTDYQDATGLPDDFVVTEMQMVTATRGYATGNRHLNGQQLGVVYKTDNGGSTWQRMTGVEGAQINDMIWLDETHALACGSYGTVMVSNDAGASWKQIAHGFGVYEDLNAMTVISGSEVIAVGNDGQSAKITLTEESWAITNVTADDNVGASGGRLTDVISTNLGLVATVGNWDSGDNSRARLLKGNLVVDHIEWIPMTGTATGLRSISVSEDIMEIGIVTGKDGQLYKLKQSGTDWLLEPYTTGLTASILDAYFINESKGVVITAEGNYNYGALKFTTDGGVTWTYVDGQTNNYISFEHMANSTSSSPYDVKLIARTTTQNIDRITSTDGGDNWGSVGFAGPSNGATSVWSHKMNEDAVAPAIAFYNSSIMFKENISVDAGIWVPVTGVNGSISQSTGFTYAYNDEMCFDVLALNTSNHLFQIRRIGQNTIEASSFSSNINCVASNDESNVFYTLSSSGQIKSYRIDGNGNLAEDATNQVFSFLSEYNQLSAGNDYLLAMNTAGDVVRISLNNDRTVSSQTQTPIIRTQYLNAISKFGQDAFASGLDGDLYRITFGSFTRIQSGIKQTINDLHFYSKTDDYAYLLAGASGGKIIKEKIVLSTNAVIPNIINAGTEDILTVHYEDDKYLAGSRNNKIYYQGQGLSNSTPSNIAGSSSSGDVLAFLVTPDQETIPLQALVSGEFSRWQKIIGTQRTSFNEVYGLPYESAYFSDALNGSVVGHSGMVSTTHDGGVSWQKKPVIDHSIGINNAFVILRTIGQSVGGNLQVAGDDGKVFEWSDSEWSDLSVSASTTVIWTDMALHTSSGDLILVGADGTSGVTGICDGNNWSSIGTTVNITDISSTANGALYGVAGSEIWVFNNNWSFVYALENGVIANDISAYDDQSIYVTGNDGYMRRIFWKNNAWNELMEEWSIGANGHALALTGPNSGVVIGTLNNNAKAAVFNELSGKFSTLFYYDALGRIVTSQNSKQREGEIKKWSYTLYDGLGRVYQAGLKTENTSEGEINFPGIRGTLVGTAWSPSTINDELLVQWITSTGLRNEVTTTYYDHPVEELNSPLPADFTAIHFENLRKRVATVTYEGNFDGNDYTYDHATHYAYDIHGNVKSLIQDNPVQAARISEAFNDVTPEQERFKRMDYIFDLISGNVHQVIYQKGLRDQYYHRYQYDANNRIQNVETSRDGVIWDTDARYFYYDHGPLARIELGDGQVQGIDYAYTLQGWLKGINSSNLDEFRDMGQDGYNSTTNPNALFAKDVMSFSLGYNKNDYQAINSNANWLASVDSESDIYTAWSPLYNGNIGFMSTTLKKKVGTSVMNENLGMVYNYDQLNRLKKASGYTNFNNDSNAWDLIVDTLRYYNEFDYDANGNILTQKRYDAHNEKFEDLTYKYNVDDSGRPYQNRLYHVNDAIHDEGLNDLASDDIEDQGVFVTTGDNGTPNDLTDDTRIDRDNNYIYTSIGELKADAAEEIQEIIWRVDSKIAYIKRTDESSKANLGFEYDAMGNRIAKHTYTDNTFTLIEKSTYYVRDASGNVMSTYQYDANLSSYDLIERGIYGSSRVGLDKEIVSLNSAPETTTIDPAVDGYSHVLGAKHYELSNHLGNVLTVISDRKAYVPAVGPVAAHFESTIISVTDYSPFGAPLTARTWSSEEYRYSFNGKESDSEASNLGEGTQDYGFRIYNPSLGKFLSVDPLLKDFPMLSTYQFAANTPIQAIDLDGLENCHFSLVWDDEGSAHLKLLYIEPETFGLPTLVINGGYIADFWSTDVMRQEVERYSTISKKDYYEERQNGKQENEEFQEQRFDYLDNLGPAMAVGTVMKGSAKNPAPSSPKGAKKELNAKNEAKTSTFLVKTGTQFSKHSLKRLAERGVTQDMAELAISKGQKFYDPSNESINYVLPNCFASGKSLLVGTNPLTGEVTTVIRSNKNLINSRFIPIK